MWPGHVSQPLWISALSYVKSTYLLELLWGPNDFILLKVSKILAVVLFKYSNCCDQSVSLSRLIRYTWLFKLCHIPNSEVVWCIWYVFPSRENDILKQGWQTFLVKGQIINILGFSGHTVSVTAIQLCCMKTAADSTWAKGRACVPIRLYLWRLEFKVQMIFQV